MNDGIYIKSIGIYQIWKDGWAHVIYWQDIEKASFHELADAESWCKKRYGGRIKNGIRRSKTA